MESAKTEVGDAAKTECMKDENGSDATTYATVSNGSCEVFTRTATTEVRQNDSEDQRADQDQPVVLKRKAGDAVPRNDSGQDRADAVFGGRRVNRDGGHAHFTPRANAGSSNYASAEPQHAGYVGSADYHSIDTSNLVTSWMNWSFNDGRQFRSGFSARPSASNVGDIKYPLPSGFSAHSNASNVRDAKYPP